MNNGRREKDGLESNMKICKANHVSSCTDSIRSLVWCIEIRATQSPIVMVWNADWSHFISRRKWQNELNDQERKSLERKWWTWKESRFKRLCLSVCRSYLTLDPFSHSAVARNEPHLTGIKFYLRKLLPLFGSMYHTSCSNENQIGKQKRESLWIGLGFYCGNLGFFSASTHLVSHIQS